MFNSLITKVTRPFSLNNNCGRETQYDQARRPGDRVEDGFLLVGDTASERTTVHASQFAGNQVDSPPRYGDVTERDTLPSYSEYTASVEKYSPLTNSASYSGFTFDTPLHTGTPTIQTSGHNYCHGSQCGPYMAPPTIPAGAYQYSQENQYGNTAMQVTSPTIQVANQPNNSASDTDFPRLATGRNNSERSAISDVPFAVGRDFSLATTIQDIRSQNLLQHETFNACKYDYDFKVETSFLQEHGFPDDHVDMEIQNYDNMYVQDNFRSFD